MTTDRPDLVQRLRAASRDQRLSTGALYCEAANAIESLRLKIEGRRTEWWDDIQSVPGPRADDMQKAMRT